MPRRFRSTGILTAVALALTLVAAPMRAALRPACDLCPPDCPMHQVRAAGKQLKCHGEAPAPKPKCHGAMGVRHDDDDRRTPRIAKPPCGNHGAMPGLALAPMILPGATITRVAPICAAAPAAAFRAPRRGADPPDTPPPIRRA